MAVLHCLYRFSDTKPVDSGLLGTPLFLWISARSGGVVKSCLSPGSCVFGVLSWMGPFLLLPSLCWCGFVHWRNYGDGRKTIEDVSL